jgi:nitrite reductase/ring-hydroxylating ferredoxin subunit/uncharacterized membrane protein
MTITHRLEAAEELDPVAGPLRSLGSGLRKSPLGDLLSGTPFGHPAHPALAVVPLGSWSSAVVLDLALRDSRAARFLVGLGILAAVPAAASGLSDWSDTELGEQRVGFVHAATNTAALALFAASWWARRKGGRHGLLWSVVGLSVSGLGGWLGGHLAYGMGVGVDTNAFGSGPQEWTPIEEPSEALALACVEGARIVLATAPGGPVRGLADRCSHRGGPLSEGTVEGNCVECPWHGSRFDLDTGRAVRGPASVPQPAYEVRRRDGRLEARRVEHRGLRQRAV